MNIKNEILIKEIYVPTLCVCVGDFSQTFAKLAIGAISNPSNTLVTLNSETKHLTSSKAAHDVAVTGWQLGGNYICLLKASCLACKPWPDVLSTVRHL